jgi:hypothetical protein
VTLAAFGAPDAAPRGLQTAVVVAGASLAIAAALVLRSRRAVAA